MDGVLTQLDDRFNKHNEAVMKLNFLFPGSIGEGSRMEDLEEIFNFYKSLIPDCTLERAKGEYDVWCHAWNRSDLEKPKDLITALASCDSVAYPTIKRLLTIGALQPVSTASAERSFSNLRRLKTWLRSTMGQNRLSGLALMFSHREKIGNEDIPEILDRFATKKARVLKIIL